MKNLLIILSLIFTISCSIKKSKINDCGKWILIYTNHGAAGKETIVCDSLQMVSAGEAYIFIKGLKTHIFADKMYPAYITCP